MSTESYPLPRRSKPKPALLRLGVAATATAVVAGVAGCSSNPADAPPPTITPAQAAQSPPAAGAVPGTVVPLDAAARAAYFDESTASLVTLTSAADGTSAVTLVGADGRTQVVPLDTPATAMAGGDGEVFVAATGGYHRVDLADRSVARVDVRDRAGAEFTAIARRDDGRMVLGTADGEVLTLTDDSTVGAEVKIFARVDEIVTVGDTAVVLDRAQTSVTTLDAEGSGKQQALRAGDGATTMVADDSGWVVVADTRGGELLVYGVDPLILRQRYPVPDAPYGLATSDNGWAWVSQSATNTVVGYDLATGIPVEKVRYPTVQQPDSLAFDEASGTLYVVSGAGAGVQVIRSAEGA
ncbi:YncE family protein [Mycolicibacterium vaccae]|uniref:YncE family protein n=1 Tax=Mycolicibacterium vaccae TaxID=1810 RepID=UPI003D0873CF